MGKYNTYIKLSNLKVYSNCNMVDFAAIYFFRRSLKFDLSTLSWDHPVKLLHSTSCHPCVAFLLVCGSSTFAITWICVPTLIVPSFWCRHKVVVFKINRWSAWRIFSSQKASSLSLSEKKKYLFSLYCYL